ncbi:MAG: DNA cytosine methyltransferase, partial [Chloroflexi bacterium]|nr:DNA cytosine methyltransferase [Chloroflexota bacterium]
MLTCADLFCGAGGFSEGFRQAGFRVTKALDIWAPAVLTHERNHPDTEAIRGDILAYAPERLGPVDVLIGSPPCTEFSFANRGGGGDIEEGLRLVYRFLRFVHELRPRWWAMENVPRVLEYLPDEVPLRKLGIDKRGSLPIPTRAVLTSADFGTPQLRRRAFSGDFPLPETTHSEAGSGGSERWRTLRDVVAGLPDPLRPAWKVAASGGDLATEGGEVASRRERAGSTAIDPLYGFELPLEELTDHFSKDLLLSEEEVRENRKAKEDHSWYGRMAFPDELDRPARTVMATNLRVSRETTVIPAGRHGFRRLSVREASSVQGFPITYQWWGRSTPLKYKLVGNAVAPPVAFAVARGIARAARATVRERPYVIEHVDGPAPAPSERE